MIRRLGRAAIRETKRELRSRGIREFRVGRLVAAIVRGRSVPDVVDFGAFRLAIDPLDAGGAQYLEASYWGELISPLEREIVRRFRPTLFVDVGANYGFTALVHNRLNAACRIVAVEPSSHAAGYLRRNLDANGCSAAVVIEAVCTDRDGVSSFAINPHSSQDNRVVGEAGWPTIEQRAISLSTLLDHAHPGEFVYVKIDVQGYEERVLRGGSRFLDAHDRWLIKMEFGPKWLRMQGTDPVGFLSRLVNQYQVMEIPKRIRFRGDSLPSLAEARLKFEDATAFVSYVEALAHGDGWCDLLVAPRSLAVHTP